MIHFSQNISGFLTYRGLAVLATKQSHNDVVRKILVACYLQCLRQP